MRRSRVALFLTAVTAAGAIATLSASPGHADGRRRGDDPRPARCRLGGPRRRRRSPHQGSQRPRPVLPAGLGARRRPVVPDGRDPAARVGHARGTAGQQRAAERRPDADARSASFGGAHHVRAVAEDPGRAARVRRRRERLDRAQRAAGTVRARAGDRGRAVERGGQRAGPQAGRVQPVLRPRHRPDDGRAGLRRGRARRANGGVRRSRPVRAVQPGLAGHRRHAAAGPGRTAARHRPAPASRACPRPSPGWRPTT